MGSPWFSEGAAVSERPHMDAALSGSLLSSCMSSFGPVDTRPLQYLQRRRGPGQLLGEPGPTCALPGVLGVALGSIILPSAVASCTVHAVAPSACKESAAFVAARTRR